MDFPFPRKNIFSIELIERLGFTQSALEHCCSLFLYLSFYLLRVQASKKAFDGHESRCEQNKKKEKHRNPCTKKNAKNHSFSVFFLKFCIFVSVWISEGKCNLFLSLRIHILQLKRERLWLLCQMKSWLWMRIATNRTAWQQHQGIGKFMWHPSYSPKMICIRPELC